MRLLVNIDAGECDAEPEALFRCADIVNVSCGAHAGDLTTMRRAFGLAVRSKALVAAHPGYADREHFGRMSVRMSDRDLRATLREQLQTWRSIAAEWDVPCFAVKPHGALYHDASTDVAVAAALIETTLEVLGTPRVIGPEWGVYVSQAHAFGLTVLREGFADRRVGHDGRLVPRRAPDAFLSPEEAEAQVHRFLRERSVDTVCVHADTPGAVELAERVRACIAAAELTS